MGNPYEIRCNLLSEASSLLMEEWRRKCDTEMFLADKISGYKPEIFPAPKVDEIIALATRLKEFVDAQ